MSGRLIFVLTAVSAALIVGGVFWALGKNEEAAADAATRFAGALVHNDRGAAPDGAREYVTGVRAYFGPVTGARMIGTHNEHAGSGDSQRTFPVADLLLRTARGPAVIELAFDSGGFASEKETGVYELDPEEAPELPARDREQLASASAARGGIPANEIAFKEATARRRQTPAPRPAEEPARVKRSHGWRKAQADLRCVQRARGDVANLLECARYEPIGQHRGRAGIARRDQTGTQRERLD
jgi:hypothetical protein